MAPQSFASLSQRYMELVSPCMNWHDVSDSTLESDNASISTQFYSGQDGNNGKQTNFPCILPVHSNVTSSFCSCDS